MKTCSFDGCERPLACGGLCTAHYQQQYHGKELKPLRPYAPRKKSVANSLARWREMSRDAISHTLVDGMWLPV